MDRRILFHQDGHAIEILPGDGDDLDRRTQCAQEQHRRIAEQADIQAVGVECFGHRRARRKLLPFKRIRQVIQHAGRFHHGLGVVALVAHHQRLRVRSQAQQGGGDTGRQF